MVLFKWSGIWEGCMQQKTFRDRWSQALVLAGSMAYALLPFPSMADTPLHIPWECSHYTGDAQTRCVNAFLETQQKKITELEGKLQAQEGAVNQLKNQLDRQSTTTTDLQRRLAERPTTSMIPIPYSYGYPLGLGFGLQFGGSEMYASPYYRPFWGPRRYGYWDYRW